MKSMPNPCTPCVPGSSENDPESVSFLESTDDRASYSKATESTLDLADLCKGKVVAQRHVLALPCDHLGSRCAGG